MAAAMQAFSRKGYDAATVEDIAAAAGVSKGLVYHYFRSKEDILAATAEAWVSTLEGYMRRLATAEDTATNKLLAAQRLATEHVLGKWEFLQVQVEFWSELHRRPEIARLHAQMFRRFRSLLAAIIEEGITSGEFRSVRVQEVASLMMAMVDGLVLQRMADRRALSWRGVADAMNDLLFNGLAAREKES